MQSSSRLTHSVLLLGAFSPAFLLGSEISAEPIVIEALPTLTPNSITIFNQESRIAHQTDGSELIRATPGVELGRMGGHGAEPVLRGQQQGRVRIEQCGTVVTAGCPNRMDPPTAYASAARSDRTTITLGVASLTGLPPRPGGTVEFSREAPAPGWSGKGSGRLSSNGPIRSMAAEAAYGAQWVHLRGVFDAENADNYKDGDGSEIASAYQTTGGPLMALGALGRTS